MHFGNRKEITSSDTILERFLYWINFFDFKQVYRLLDKVKQKGYSASDLMKVLVMVPFAGKDNIHSFLSSSFGKVSAACKDNYHRLKKREDINWESSHTAFVKRCVKLVAKKGTEKIDGSPKCLIIDDTVVPKKGKLMEGVGKLWDQADMCYSLGSKLLLLGYFDGKSFLPVNFTLHREKGKKKSKTLWIGYCRI